MKLKQLKLNKLKSAVTLNDSEKKTVRGGYWGDDMHMCVICDNDTYTIIPYGNIVDCVEVASTHCPHGFHYHRCSWN